MSYTHKTHLRYIIGLFVFASIFIAGSVVQAYHLGAEDSALNEVAGEITAIDTNHHTISLKSDDFGWDGRVLVIRLDDSTKLVSKCDVEIFSDPSGLKVGDKITVSYYEMNDRFFADMILPSESELFKC